MEVLRAVRALTCDLGHLRRFRIVGRYASVSPRDHPSVLARIWHGPAGRCYYVRLVYSVLLVAADPVAVVSRIGAADREAAPSLMRRSRPGQSNSEEDAHARGWKELGTCSGVSVDNLGGVLACALVVIFRA